MLSSNGYPGDLAHSEKDESGMGDEGLCLEMVLRRRGFRGLDSADDGRRRSEDSDTCGVGGFEDQSGRRGE